MATLLETMATIQTLLLRRLERMPRKAFISNKASNDLCPDRGYPLICQTRYIDAAQRRKRLFTIQRQKNLLIFVFEPTLQIIPFEFLFPYLFC